MKSFSSLISIPKRKKNLKNKTNKAQRIKLFVFSAFKVTPADYQPPGFKEGVYDRIWFQGIPVHFKVGHVETSYHSLKVRVSVDQGQVKKLEEGNEVKETAIQVGSDCSTASQSTIDPFFVLFPYVVFAVVESSCKKSR